MPHIFARVPVALVAATLLAGCNRALPDRADAAPLATVHSLTVQYLCGAQAVTVHFDGDDARVQVENQRAMTLQRAIAASGARYEAIGTGKTEFWTKGDWARLTVEDQEYPECRETNRPGADVLRGKEWVVRAVGPTALVADSRITLNFGDDGRLHGRSSCNHYGGSYAVEGSTLTVSQLMGTLMACAPPLMAQEQRYLELLKATQRYELALDGALTLVTGDGQRIVARRE